MSIRVLVADGRTLILEGLRRLLDGKGVEISGHVASLGELEQVLPIHTPDAVLAEIHLGGDDLLAALAAIRQRFSQVPFLFFSDSKNPAHEAQAYQGGAAGYLHRGVTSDELLTAIRAVALGQQLWTTVDQRRLGNYSRSGAELIGELAPLTPREVQVLKLLTTGATNKEISESLAISHETVKEHVQHVLEKIGVNDRTQAAVWAVRNHLV